MGPMPGRRRLAALALALGAGAKRPNLLLALVDDLGSGDVQYNDPAMVTPELSSLAEDGVILDRFYAAATAFRSCVVVERVRYGARTSREEAIHRTASGLTPLRDYFLQARPQLCLPQLSAEQSSCSDQSRNRRAQ